MDCGTKRQQSTLGAVNPQLTIGGQQRCDLSDELGIRGENRVDRRCIMTKVTNFQTAILQRFQFHRIV